MPLLFYQGEDDLPTLFEPDLHLVRRVSKVIIESVSIKIIITVHHACDLGDPIQFAAKFESWYPMLSSVGVVRRQTRFPEQKP